MYSKEANMSSNIWVKLPKTCSCKTNEIPKVWGCNDMIVYVWHTNGDMEESEGKYTIYVIKKLLDH